MAGYVIAEIRANGMLYCVDTPPDRGGEAHIIHRESALPFADQPTFSNLLSAKREIALRGDHYVVLAVSDSGGVITLWAKEKGEALVRERLKIWSGCYGLWPICLLRKAPPLKQATIEAAAV